MPQHILLIEDDLVDQMAFRRMMKQKHPDLTYEVAPSIEQARTLLQQSDFTYLIIDFQLGDGTALDLLPFPKQQNFVILSGFLADEVQQKLDLAGAKMILLKDQKLTYLDRLAHLFDSSKAQKNDSQSSPNKTKSFALLEKSFDGNVKEIRAILQVFLKENPKDLQLLNTLEQKEQWPDFHRLAHRIKSGYRLLEIPKALSLLETMEQTPFSQMASTDRQEKIEQLVRQSEQVYQLIQQKLQTLT